MAQGFQNHVAFLKGGNANNVAVGMRKHIEVAVPVVPTAAGNTDVYLIAPEDGILDSLEFSAVDGLVANDGNYITFSLYNMKQDGLGTVGMVPPTSNATTRLTGGSALVANAKKTIPIQTNMPSTLQITAGDRLRFRIAGTGVLPNTLTGGVLLARFRS